MMLLLQVTLILGYFSFGHSYTKYGRSCQDIGCPSNQQCVMQTDPCSYYHRQGECGSFPTCQLSSSSSARNCATYVCPPTKICKMDGDTPKCVDDSSKVGHVGYDTQNQNSVSAQQPLSNSGIYPKIPTKGETTPRPNIYRPVNTGTNGYQGGQVGSGYPGRQANPQQIYPQQTYPQQTYPQQTYPQQVYPQQVYPQQAYPQQASYPRQNYPQQGAYPQQGYAGYPQGQYPGYQQNYPQQTYKPNNQGTSLTDKISNSFKNLGTDILKQTLSKAVGGRA